MSPDASKIVPVGVKKIHFQIDSALKSVDNLAFNLKPRKKSFTTEIAKNAIDKILQIVEQIDDSQQRLDRHCRLCDRSW